MQPYRISIAVSLLIVCLSLVSCITTVQEPTQVPPAAEVTVEVPVPVTVEVTRIVPQQVIVEATPGPPNSCAPASFDETDQLVIGAIVPLSLSGDMLAGFGMQTGMSIAVDEINKAGGIKGRPIRLVTYDSARTETQAVATLQRLAREDCAVAVTGFLHDNVAVAAANRANALELPMIVAGATTDSIPLQQHAYVFRIAPSDTMLSTMAAEWMAEVGDYNGDNELYVVNVIDSSNMESPDLQRLEQQLEEYGIGYETLPVDLPASDFSSVIARIVSQEILPDAVFIYIADEAALEFEQQLRIAGFGSSSNSLIVNNEAALDSRRFWQIVPDGVGTVVSRIGPWHSSVTPAGRTFALKYAQYFGHWPEAYAFAAYDAIYLLADALERSDSPSGSSLQQALAETEAILASGKYYFPYTTATTESDTAYSDFMWNQWPDVHTLYLQYDESGQSSVDMPVIWPERYRSSTGPLAWSQAEAD